MHEVVYVNGDNAPEPDRLVIPRDSCGSLYTGEMSSQAHSGAVGPLHERLDNYGNRWLEGGFEYPPSKVNGDTSEVDAPQANLGANADEPADKQPEADNPASTQRKLSDRFPGIGSASSGHTGSRSDKWPASGLVDFKIPGSGA